MSTPRRHSPTPRGPFHVIQAAWSAAVVLCILAGCSKPEPAATDDDWSLDSADTLRAEGKAGGVATVYTAHFDGTQIRKISEVRKPDEGHTEKGDYEFNGARLIRYRGAALLGQEEIDLSFDLQGALIESKGAGDAEVSAVRDRASLLRSLALTRRTTQSHGGG